MLDGATYVMKVLFGILAAFSGPDFQDIQNQFHCLQENVYFEARNQPFRGMRAVATVTLNRLESPNYPNTICEVVKERRGQRCQFSWACENVNHHVRTWHPAEIDAWNKAGQAAAVTMFYGKLDGFDGVKFFKAIYARSRFHDGLNLVETIGDHQFYNRNEGS